MTRFTMLAIPFGSRSQDLGGFIEVWEPSAVRRTLDERIDLRALKNHDRAFVLGRISAGTMRVHADHRGLHAVVDADASISYVNDLRLAVQRRDISGASFAFRAIAVEWLREDPPVRRVTDAEISEISIVTFPAFLGTRVSVSDAPRSYAAPREERSMRHDTVEGGLEYAAPRSSHDRRDLALRELEQALRYWERNGSDHIFEIHYGPPPRASVVSTVKVPPARTLSLAMAKNWQRVIESTL